MVNNDIEKVKYKNSDADTGIIENNNDRRRNNQNNKGKKINAESIDLNLRLPGQNKDGELTIKDVLTIFRRNSGIIFTVTLISIVVGMVAAAAYYFLTVKYTGTVSGIISYNYKGAEDGLDPYGRLLDVTKLKSPKVLEPVLSQLNLYEKGVTVEDIRQNIRIEGIIPEDAMQRILIIHDISPEEPSKLEDLNELSYIPTQYTVTLRIPKKLSVLKGAIGVELLSSVLRSYQEYFFEEYSDRSILSTAIVSLPYNEYDYYDSFKVLNGQFNNMINYLNAKRNEAPYFRANSTQMSFGDIITNLNLIKTIDLANMRALVEVRLVTKDIDFAISCYKAIILDKTLEKDVQMENARITKEAAENYEKDTAVLFGSTGAYPALQFSQPSETYDSLIEQAVAAEEQAVSLQRDIEYYQKRISDMEMISLIQDPVIVANRKLDVAQVESLIESVSKKMAEWINVINDTVDEYMESVAMKDVTKVVLFPQYKSSFISYLKIMAIITIAVIFMGFFLSAVYVCIKNIMRHDGYDDRAVNNMI